MSGKPVNRGKKGRLSSTDDQLLARLSDGFSVSQDEYDQVAYDLPPEAIAQALEQRWRWTEDAGTLLEAARVYMRAGHYYQAFELCTRSPRSTLLRQLANQILPRIRRDYPEDEVIGKLLDEAFLVIDLRSGKVERFPGLLPAREWLDGMNEGS